MKINRSLGRLSHVAIVSTAIACAACSSNDDEGSAAYEGLGSSGPPLAADEVTLFASSDTPAILADSDTAAVELGVRFRSDVDGTVSGVRYYRSSANRGPHTGHLWSSSGELLASATFTSTRRTGWQNVHFAMPVAVKAGQSYVASYHTDVGRYSATVGYFSGKGKDSPPLHAPADGVSGANGVYHYGATAFPSDTYQGTNYWVDVIMKPSASAPVDAGTPPPPVDAGTTPPPKDSGTTSPPDASPPPIDAGTTPPSSGAFPNASNTGVPSGTTLTASGGLDINTNGAVIDARDITGCVTVNADNVTIKRTRIRAGNCWQPIGNHGKNLHVIDTELDGQNSSMSGLAIVGGNYTLTRVNAHSSSDGPRLDGSGPITIEDSWIHDPSNLPGDHGDGIQAYGLNGGPVIIRHNTIVGGTNAAVFTADGATGDMYIDNNLMSGGGYTLRVYDNHVWVRNNLIVKDSYEYGPVSAFRDPGAADPGVTIIEWTNNHLCTGSDGSGIGALLAEP